MKFTLKTIFLLLLITTFNTSCSTNKSEFYHIMMLEYTESANMDEVTSEILAFGDIPSVLAISFGKIKKNQKNKINNFTYCLSLKFKDRKGMDAYFIDPYHQKIYKKHKPLIASIYTVDFNSISLKK